MEAADAPRPALAVAPEHPRRLVYLGTPDMAVPPLRALVAAGFDVALVVTRPDKRRGRGSATAPSPVKAAAIELGLPVTSTLDDAVGVGADLGVVVAFGRIIPARILAELPMVNLHFSLLPRWRGAAPVERALLAGDATTGVDVMVVEEGLDTGAIFAEAEVPIGSDTTAGELRAELVEVGSGLLVETLRSGLRDPRPQVGGPRYAEKLQPAEYELDWTRPAVELHRWVRLGGAWTTFRDRRLKVWRSAVPPTGEGIEVATGDGVLELLEVQPEGKPRMAAPAWANGARPEPGELGAADALAEPS